MATASINMKALAMRIARVVATVFVAGFFAVSSGCASRSFVWVNDLAPDEGGGAYVIASGDVINVRVFNQENLSTRARVRSDGKIAVPLVGDVLVRGRSPAVVSKELEDRLKQYVVSPAVTITVEETQPTSVSVLGEVAHPGNYSLDSTSGVVQALAAAGGLTEYASRGSIYVIRRDPAETVRFTFTMLTEADSRAAAFRLRAGDVVVVE